MSSIFTLFFVKNVNYKKYRPTVRFSFHHIVNQGYISFVLVLSSLYIYEVVINWVCRWIDKNLKRQHAHIFPFYFKLQNKLGNTVSLLFLCLQWLAECPLRTWSTYREIRKNVWGENGKQEKNLIYAITHATSRLLMLSVKRRTLPPNSSLQF